MIRLIGGEMPIWSDLDGRHGPGPVRGAALATLLAGVTGRTLVAGPHDPALIDALTVDDLTLLVRGLPDAETLAARYPDVTVCCGGPEKLIAEAPYDTVIVLDGLERLCSVEASDLAWAEVLELLTAVLQPGGRLLLSVENFFGLHRLVSLAPAVTDSDWATAGAHDATRPAGRARLLDHFGAADLRVERLYAAYPDPIAPAALLGSEILAEDRLHGFVSATLSRVCAPTDDVLVDPRRLAADALRHGAAADLAPGWIVSLRSADPAPHTDELLNETGAADQLPEALLDDGPVRRHGDRWLRDAEREVPHGSTLADLLITASLRHDLPVIRDLLHTWQNGDSAGVCADHIIVGPDGRHTALVAAGSPDDAIRSFAATLIRGAYAHPWPAPLDEHDLARTIGTLAGRNLSPTPVAEPRRPDRRSFRELSAERDRLARELVEARARTSWYENQLGTRESDLRQARHTIELLSDSGPARAGKAFMGGARAARRTVRLVTRTLNPRA